MTQRKKILITLTSVIALLVLLSGSFFIFSATNIYRAEKQYEKLDDSKSLVELCIHLTASKDYERQIKYIKKLMERMEFVEFSKIMAQNRAWKKTDKEVIYQVMLTRYLEAYLHLDRPDQYLLEFPAVYKKYLSEKACFEYIEYSLSDKILSDTQLATVLNALNAHMEGEEKEIRIFNLSAQAAIYSSQSNEEQYSKINEAIEVIKKELLAEKSL